MKEVRRLLLLIALLLTTAAYSDEDRLPVNIAFEYREPFLSGQYFDQILSLRLDYDLREGRADRVDMTWPGFTPGMASLDDVWRMGVSARPQVWKLGHRMSNDEKPERPPELYFTLHYLSKRMSAKLFYPLAETIEGQELPPGFELERLEIFRSGRFTALARGGTRSDMPDWGVGLTYRLGDLQLGAFTGDPVLYVSFQEEITGLSH